MLGQVNPIPLSPTQRVLYRRRRNTLGHCLDRLALADWGSQFQTIKLFGTSRAPNDMREKEVIYNLAGW